MAANPVLTDIVRQLAISAGVFAVSRPRNPLGLFVTSSLPSRLSAISATMRSYAIDRLGMLSNSNERHARPSGRIPMVFFLIAKVARDLDPIEKTHCKNTTWN
jgi:hypothetical protein